MATVVNSPGRRKDWWTSAFTKGPADTPTPHQPSPWWKMGKNLWSHLKKLKDFTAAKKEDGSESTLMTDGKLSMKRIRDLMIKTLLWHKWHHCRRKKRLLHIFCTNDASQLSPPRHVIVAGSRRQTYHSSLLPETAQMMHARRGGHHRVQNTCVKP